MEYAIAQKRRFSVTDGRWLLVAVVLHALVFAIPLRKLPDSEFLKSAELVVRLIATQPAVEPDPVADEPQRVETRTWPKILKKIEIPPRQTAIEERSSPTTSEPGQEVEEPAPSPGVSTTRLMGMRSELTDRVPMDESSDQARYRLGAPLPFDTPENWQPHTGAEALAPFDNTFNGMVAPSKTVVVDEWKEADGSHGIILETPSGHRLCGRRAPWDPMHPMIEPLMVFRICGGDFAVPFKFKPREPLNRDFIDPVAKDAIQLPDSPD